MPKLYDSKTMCVFQLAADCCSQRVVVRLLAVWFVPN